MSLRRPGPGADELGEERLEELPGTPQHLALRSARRRIVGLCFGLFFLPFLNGLAGGIAGGYRLGTVRRALDNVMPALAWGALVGLTLGIGGLALGGVVAFVPAIWLFFTAAGLFVGSVIGGALAPRAIRPGSHVT